MDQKWKIRKGGIKNADYESFIRSKSCIVCGHTPVDMHHCFHVRSTPYLCLPLCRIHHTAGNDSYHVLEWQRFQDVHNIDLKDAIINFLSEYIDEHKNLV